MERPSEKALCHPGGGRGGERRKGNPIAPSAPRKHGDAPYSLLFSNLCSVCHGRRTTSREMRAPHALLLSCLDVFLSAVLVAPLVVAYWRGTWQLMDALLVPLVGDHPSAWASFTFGSVLHLVFALFRPPMPASASPKRQTLFKILSRLYTTVFGLACVNSWRGAWKALDHHLGISMTADAATFAAAIAVLSATRTLRNISAPPFVVSVDSSTGYFSFPTALRTRLFAADNSGHHNVESSQGYSSVIGTYGLLCWNLCRYIVDCLLSVLVIGTLVVVVWRGAWNLLDQLLFPERADWSAWSSLVLGYGLVIFVFSLQVPVQALCSHLQGIWRLIVADLYLFLSFGGTVNVWRGIWNLLNVYFLPEVPLLSNLVTHLVCLIALMLFGCSNSILVRGVLLDGEEGGGNCVVFPILYIRFFARKAEERQASETERELRTVHTEAVSHPLVLTNHHKQRTEINETDGTTVPLTLGDHIINDTA